MIWKFWPLNKSVPPDSENPGLGLEMSKVSGSFLPQYGSPKGVIYFVEVESLKALMVWI